MKREKNTKRNANPLSRIGVSFGGDNRDRTDDPLLAKQVLSQLSYTPIFGFVSNKVYYIP